MISSLKKKFSKKAVKIYKKIISRLPLYFAVFFVILYFYGMLINSFATSMKNFYQGSTKSTLVLNPIKNIFALFTPIGIGLTFFLTIMYLLLSKKYFHLLSGVKIIRDSRGFNVLSEGSHGTSGWMTKNEMEKVLEYGSVTGVKNPILGKVKESYNDNDGYADYVALKDGNGLNKHIMVYGASGAGKSRGFVKPFILKTAQRGESMILVDPKAEFFESMSGYLIDKGYTVKAFNLLDMENSDAWNCINETSSDPNMVQSVAEVIIRNTSNASEKQDFWEKGATLITA